MCKILLNKCFYLFLFFTNYNVFFASIQIILKVIIKNIKYSYYN